MPAAGDTLGQVCLVPNISLRVLYSCSFRGGGSEEPDPSGEGLDITDRTPDSVIGETLVIRGTVEFKNLLRIDGHFAGKRVYHNSRTNY